MSDAISELRPLWVFVKHILLETRITLLTGSSCGQVNSSNWSVVVRLYVPVLKGGGIDPWPCINIITNIGGYTIQYNNNIATSYNLDMKLYHLFHMIEYIFLELVNIIL